jgi:DNA 3'-phosphatase
MSSCKPVHLLMGLVAALLVAGCGADGAGEQGRDLGQIVGGKGDFSALEIDLPCIGELEETTFSFETSDPVQIGVTQPSVASSKRAYARIRLGDDTGYPLLESASHRETQLRWYPPDKAMTEYALTVVNRSSTKELCAHLTIEVLPTYVAPSKRRAFSTHVWFPGYAKKVPVAFFDADSTLRVSKSGSVTPNGANDLVLLPGVATGLRKAMLEGALIAVVSNQKGVSLGYVSLEAAEGALATTAKWLGNKQAQVHYFDMATHDDEDRKPKTGMATRLEDQIKTSYDIDIDWNKSYMVGDAGWKRNVDTEPDGSPGIDFSNSDRKFAEALGIPYINPREYFGWVEHGIKRFNKKAEVEAFNQANPDFPQ